LEDHEIGMPPNLKIYPVLLFTQVGSHAASEFQRPAKSASAHQSSLRLAEGLITIPLVRVPFKYLAIRLSATS